MHRCPSRSHDFDLLVCLCVFVCVCVCLGEQLKLCFWMGWVCSGESPGFGSDFLFKWFHKCCASSPLGIFRARQENRVLWTVASLRLLFLSYNRGLLCSETRVLLHCYVHYTKTEIKSSIRLRSPPPARSGMLLWRWRGGRWDWQESQEDGLRGKESGDRVTPWRGKGCSSLPAFASFLVPLKRDSTALRTHTHTHTDMVAGARSRIQYCFFSVEENSSCFPMPTLPANPLHTAALRS